MAVSWRVYTYMYIQLYNCSVRDCMMKQNTYIHTYILVQIHTYYTQIYTCMFTCIHDVYIARFWYLNVALCKVILL